MSDGDRIDVIALVIMSVGLAWAVTGFSILIFSPYESDVRHDLLGWGLYFIGSVLTIAGRWGYRRRKIDDLFLKKVDLWWVLCGSLAVFFAFIAVPISGIGQHWERLQKQSEEAKEEIVKMLDGVYDVKCPGYDMVAARLKDDCHLIKREANRIRHKGSVPLELDSIVSRGLIPVEQTKMLLSRASYVMETVRYYDGTWYKFIVWVREMGEPLFKLVMLFAVALRLNKSITEVYWMPRKHLA